jgi:tetratricopeptide (TPR) repeat protein
LDDPKIGPMALLEAQSPSVNHEGLATDIYKEALRAYVGTRQLEKAQQVMVQLEKAVGAQGDAETNRRLTQIYIRLGRELQEQLARLRQENKMDQLQAVSQSFVSFLEAISRRAEGNSFSSLHWVAETYYGLGAGMDPGGKSLPPEAEQYYKKAAETFRTILERCKTEPGFAPQPTAVTSVTLRLASSLRGLGQYDEAMKLILSILQEKENRLDVQIEAAQTYQDWGQDRPGYYEIAIRGGHEKEGRYLVWGWGGIANRVAPMYDKYRSTFHQARYNLALCRFNLAQTQTGKQRAETLKQAELDITRVYRLYPEMGGDEWYGKYDALLKKTQKLLGEEPAGLKSPGRPSVANAK